MNCCCETQNMEGPQRPSVQSDAELARRLQEAERNEAAARASYRPSPVSRAPSAAPVRDPTEAYFLYFAQAARRLKWIIFGDIIIHIVWGLWWPPLLMPLSAVFLVGYVGAVFLARPLLFIHVVICWLSILGYLYLFYIQDWLYVAGGVAGIAYSVSI